MKTFSLFTAILLSCLAFNSAQAAPAETQITYLSCSSLSEAGATSVTYSGPFGEHLYFNISNVSPLGFPFTQQAKLVSAQKTREGVSFKLETMVTSDIVYLNIKKDSFEGSLSETARTTEKSIPLNCVGHIEKI